ncbi:MAG: 16S rRNA (cytidine(1402)-2'-O)-methyltransferase [Ruminococcus sp.]|nr:16S rRNA (cytidine(1402)-2'-O)-methyltransferase [Ruminococcus sp.]MDD7344602.1 16S rRNA (cytidine(1402)-2'-O)-methyltransferase [Ruminococcus sp.]MDY4909997.1 16S rRNA (cytidine(1402)-2'-O)-methyltransferase [Candidatus Fimenecus sp.]MDY6059940.1 16S rRNA (cytidine(1402)-2'-O)-methyltransferase [Candidatus Fimenecus sp.]
MSGKLYVVGTPIGNLSDFSPRAVETLASVDFIAAEDTRVTLKLLNHFEIKKPMVSYFEHNRRERGEIILERIKSGENCAIVTDAGMPAISDPGEDLVDLCLSNGITVESVPGPTAFATAMAMSGLPSGRFTFEGFLSVNKPSRREHLEEIVSERRTMVFYEAPHKLTATLKDLYKYLGDRRIALIKELTKIHETVERTTLSEACEKYSAQTPKGEFVIVIEGSTEPKQKEVSLDEAVALAKGLVENGMAINDAAKEIAKETKLKKGDIYKALLGE